MNRAYFKIDFLGFSGKSYWVWPPRPMISPRGEYPIKHAVRMVYCVIAASLIFYPLLTHGIIPLFSLLFTDSVEPSMREHINSVAMDIAFYIVLVPCFLTVANLILQICAYSEWSVLKEKRIRHLPDDVEQQMQIKITTTHICVSENYILGGTIEYSYALNTIRHIEIGKEDIDQYLCLCIDHFPDWLIGNPAWLQAVFSAPYRYWFPEELEPQIVQALSTYAPKEVSQSD